MATQAERRAATTEALIAAARDAFVENGYADTSVDDVADRVGMSKGAVYHHYTSKVDLFRAVFESVEQQLQQRVIQRAEKVVDPIERIIIGNDAFLEAATDPTVSRIALIEAPSVLGWTAFRAIDEKYFLGLLLVALAIANEAGAAVGNAVGAVAAKHDDEAAMLQAKVMFAGLCDLALAVATSEHPTRTLRLAKQQSRLLVRGLVRADL